MACPNCGAENREGSKFCGECGSPLGLRCPSCGAPNSAPQRFCNDCGAPLSGQASAEPPGAEAAPAAERRLVSVLFADLVGFTPLSESRDAEEVRELLSRYFDASRQVIERFGGTVEKFIGDAVMAVWGTPVAQEDDVERAVRAALDLVDAVAGLAREVGTAELSARAGVLTGEAAVTVGARGEGMVAGDLVNTASRVQSVADPGTVLVGERTRRATDAAIVYDPAGAFELKGKQEPMELWRALRVVAGRGGFGKGEGLEPPFVGREGELRLVKDLFHATAEERRARLVSVVGVAGIGKSRLAWEFEKYVDGLVDQVWWHRGRCLPYGDGVAYWALAEMVRMRARILEGEAAQSAAPKLREAIALNVEDEGERSWVEPRLAHLLGLAEHAGSDRQDLFSAWRLFFERLAGNGPCVLVFEDLQWADEGLLDFVEYLLEWSRAFPLYVMTLARPELQERRPDWGAGKRNFHAVFLEPLRDEAMDDLVSGLVPGLPTELRAQIRERADGIPLYAVETVRMLLGRGLLELAGDRYRPTGPVETLEVPETLHALIAARLDGLEPEERRLVSDASVLGKTFTADALASLCGRATGTLEPLLAGLVRKEILSVQSDPWSPERGQYGFLQALVQKVAHDTLSRRERKARHVAAAEYFETSWGADETEIVEVIASHYLDAFEADPEAEDAPALKAKARQRLGRAGERAASLAAPQEALRYFEQAAALADDAEEHAWLLEHAGMTARTAGRREQADAHYRAALSLLEEAGLRRSAGRVLARLALQLFDWQLAEGIEMMERAFAVLGSEEPDADVAMLAAELARQQFFAGDAAGALERLEFALEVAERFRQHEVVADALITKALIFQERRPDEAFALLEGALAVALENDATSPALRGYYNLAFAMMERDRNDSALPLVERGLELAGRRGDRWWYGALQLQRVCALYSTGEWEEALASMPDNAESLVLAAVAQLQSVTRIHTTRGDVAAARALVDQFADHGASADLQTRAAVRFGNAVVLRAEGRHADAVAAGEEAFETAREASSMAIASEALVEVCEAALATGDVDAVQRMLGQVDGLTPVELSQSLDAHRLRFRSRIAATEGEAEQALTRAIALYREIATPHWLAFALLDYAELLASAERHDEAGAAASEARELFERLGASPYAERASALEHPALTDERAVARPSAS